MCGSLCSINIDNAAIKFTRKRAVEQVEANVAAG
jgi:hypothetical protein